MDRHWDLRYGGQSTDRELGNCGQLPSAGVDSPAVFSRLTTEQSGSVRPSLIFGGLYPAAPDMPTRGKVSKAGKGGAVVSRRGSRQSSLSSTAHDHLEQYAQQAHSNVAGGGTHLEQSPPTDENGHLVSNSVHLTSAGELTNGAGSIVDLHSPIHQAFGVGAEGFHLDHHHHLSENHSSSSPHATEPANVTARLGLSSSLQTAADVVLSVYQSVKIDSALCKKLAGEVAQREPTQRRQEQKLNIERRSNVEALLAHVTGQEASHPCKNCHKGHGPWTQCVVYDGQMCGSCTNCWFNASGSRCTFHENNNPQSSLYARRPSVPAPASAQPIVQSHQQSSSTIPLPMSSIMSPLQADIAEWGLADPTRRLVNQAIGEVVVMSKKERYIARIEAAAKELGMRIAEYDEYLRTPEGMADQQRLHQGQAQAQSQAGDIPMGETSPVGEMP